MATNSLFRSLYWFFGGISETIPNILHYTLLIKINACTMHNYYN